MIKKQTLLLGAHTSIAGGIELALERAASIGCTTLQIFTKSNRQWQAKPISADDIQRFRVMHQKYPLTPLIVHATYLINIGSADEQLRHKSQQALCNELERCAQLNIPYLVLHPGAHGSSTPQECLDTIAESLKIVLANTPPSTSILLEIMAGQGSVVCDTFEDIAYIVQTTNNNPRIGVCFDTCHAFAAGYDFRTQETYEAMWTTFNNTIGLERLKVIHLNDSKKELGSHVDRHEAIGKGALGLEAFRLLCNDPRFFDIPKILETPEGTLEDYAKDIATIKSLLTKETKNRLGLQEE